MVTLRPARESDRRAVYRWLAGSDVTRSMMGPPLFAEIPVPTWDEFCTDYAPHFFDGSRPEVGRSFIIEVDGDAVGQINYEMNDRVPDTAELDIWLRGEEVTGRGYGTDALVALTRHLTETIGATEFVIRPSRRNPRAIRAYQKAGFVELPLTDDEQAALYGPGDYPDTVALLKTVIIR